MRQLNTLPIEDFLDKARIAIKSNQKTVTLSIKEVTDLQNSLSIVMTRLSGELDNIVANGSPLSDVVSVKMDGVSF
jgi:hypothetical protein